MKAVTGRRERQEKRRLRAGEMFAAGKSRAEVSRETGVSWRSVHEWYQAWKEGGLEALKSTGKPGPAPKFSDEEVQQVTAELKCGTLAHGYDTELWSSWPVAEVIQEEFGVEYHPGHAWRILRQLGWSVQRPTGRALERDEEAIRQWKRRRWPVVKKTP